MFYSRCVVAALLLCTASTPLAAQVTANRSSLGTALTPAADGTPRYREDTGWDNSSFSDSRTAVRYGTTLSASPFIVVLQQPTRTSAALTANANQLTLDLAGGTYTITPYLDNNTVRGGKVTVADALGSGAFLRIANGTLNNQFGTNSSLNVGDAGAVGRLFVQNATITGYQSRIGGVSTNSPGFLTLEAGSNIQLTRTLDLGTVANGSVTLSGANSMLTTGHLNIGGSNSVGVITLVDPTAVLHVSNATTTGTGNLFIDNALPSVAGANTALVVNAGTVLIGNDLALASNFSNRYGAVEINGGRVAVGGTVFLAPLVGDKTGGKIFLNDGRFEVASTFAFRPNANQNFYWKNGTLAFTGASTSLTDVQLKAYTRQGALSYGGGRAEGALATGQTLEAAGTLTLSGNTITLGGGTVRAGGSLMVNAPVTGHGTLDAVVTGSATISNTTSNDLVIGGLNGANTIDSVGDLSVGRSNVAATYTGVSTGVGSFIKEGLATQSVSGSVLNSGGAKVSAGALSFSGASSKLQTSAASIADGAKLRFEAGATGSVATANVGASPAAAVLGRLEVVGTGSTFDVAGDLTNNGIIELTDGALNVGGSLVNHGRLINDGSVSGAVIGSGVLSGSGVFDGPVVVESGAMLAPGKSPGSASFADLTLAAGSAFELEIADAAGAAGVDWDLAVVSDAFSIAATSADPVTILLKSLDPNLAAGTLENFDPSLAWSWKLVAASIANPGSVDTGAVRIDESEFLNWNEKEGGTFSIVAATDGLYVNFAPQPASVPEPGAAVLLALVGVASAGLQRRRKRRSHGFPPDTCDGELVNGRTGRSRHLCPRHK